MARKTWPLQHHRPVIHVVLTLAQGGQPQVRKLLADTGAGRANAGFELILDENDCLLCGSSISHPVSLGGAYARTFPVYMVRVQVPEVGFDAHVPAVGVSSVPHHFDGLAGFRFLNRFTYGNFGDPGQFGLEV